MGPLGPGISEITAGYTSGTPLNMVYRIPGQSFADLGLPNNFTHTVTGTSIGGFNDSVTFTGMAVPEPGTSIPLLAMLAGLSMIRARRKNQ